MLGHALQCLVRIRSDTARTEPHVGMRLFSYGTKPSGDPSPDRRRRSGQRSTSPGVPTNAATFPQTASLRPPRLQSALQPGHRSQFDWGCGSHVRARLSAIPLRGEGGRPYDCHCWRSKHLVAGRAWVEGAMRSLSDKRHVESTNFRKHGACFATCIAVRLGPLGFAPCRSHACSLSRNGRPRWPHSPRSAARAEQRRLHGRAFCASVLAFASRRRRRPWRRSSRCPLVGATSL